MSNKVAITREAARGRALLAAYSRELFQQQLSWRDARKREALAGMFPSTLEGSRQSVSPLGGQSPDWEWSGKRKG
jgi:hypothetical protein